MVELVLKDKVAVTERVSLFRFEAASGALPGYEPGAHVDFELPVGMRSYSLVDFTAPVAGVWQVAVQREEDGDGGSKAMHGLAAGDTVQASEPKNDFRLFGGDAPTLLIAGGIGVTPILSFAETLKRGGKDYAFHYATRSEGVCAFGREARDLGAWLWFDDDTAIDLSGVIGAADRAAHIYCCGPRPMIEAVRELAEKAGFDHEQVHFELFASPDSHEGDAAFEVEINDGRVFTIPADKTIVEVLEEAGVDVMYDCARGDCGICQTDVLAGEPDHRDVVLSDAERAAGEVMQICVSRAKSARLKLDI
ncbi:PDR/VanB family oxidoreductase [Alisedimentitalea sp. MJ-SS2]|uniref:PDR/VanB family oxidoreductase n=1 Tax=Aliisedimentitalea sp. MJ-SS2 TaxID=3049795 RepID=UPI00291403E8|nr:PDR/VanB family oxidoreductase [Alisedimentitalea sp. MJ-SS2]MDU8926730.1 PDR/VanB family oxidoreductase [Alisedimentitalea sp. MJ-SS2]